MTFTNVFRFRNIDLQNFNVKTIKKPSIKVMGLTKSFLDDTEDLLQKEKNNQGHQF